MRLTGCGMVGRIWGWGCVVSLELRSAVAMRRMPLTSIRNQPKSLEDVNMPVCISVINMKGGVGKTTVASMLARYAAERDLEVLAVDIDPQANLSQALMGVEGYFRFLNDKSPSIVELFEGYLPPTSATPAPSSMDIGDVVHDTPIPGLSIIPSRFDFADHLVSAASTDTRRLARCIADYFQDIDLIIIDCAPTESILTQAAYHASRYVVVPVKPEFLAILGFQLLDESLKTFRQRNRSHSIDVLGVVINHSTYGDDDDGGPERRRATEEIVDEADANDWRIFENEIGFSRGFPKMMRGDYSYIGNAQEYFDKFAFELFDSPEFVDF